MFDIKKLLEKFDKASVEAHQRGDSYEYAPIKQEIIDEFERLNREVEAKGKVIDLLKKDIGYYADVQIPSLKAQLEQARGI